LNFPLFIAKRYFGSTVKARFITLISRISMIGVGIEVMALVLILSVFNGLEDFQKSLFKTFDPDLKIIFKGNPRFLIPDNKLNQIKSLAGITFINPVLEDQALLRFGNKQVVASFKGVDDSFLKANRLKKQVVEGGYFLKSEGQSFALVGIGVFLNMGMSFENVVEPIEAWYPNHQSLRKFSINEEAIRSNIFYPSGVLEVEQNFDNQTVILPLDWMNDLVNAESKLSSYEIMLANGADEKNIQQKIIQILGSSYSVQTRDEQHAILLKAIKIEKFFVFLIMAFVMGIASFTLFYSLSLLVIEKRKDLRTLLALGISRSQLFKTILWVGFLICFSGALIGMLLGFVLGWAQQTFGIIGLGIPNALIEAYPIKMEMMDFVWTALVVLSITTFASIIPARKAVDMTFKRF
jgi:lipoprotein-releasing system permease protein